ncbi:MAG: gamma-glutamyltransferase, partial [Pseudomonadota bacterium]
DFSGAAGEYVTPIATDYGGYRVHGCPPNGQGVIALLMMNILNGYDIAAMGYGSADYLHTLIEAKKLAYEDRARFYADTDFVDVPVERLISKEYAAERRKLIDPERAADRYAAGDALLEDGDTTYLTVADADGNMVSLIQSNYRGMGSGMVPGELGFMLQDRAELFSLDPTHANALEPGKRPFHTIIPAFVTKDGEPLLSFGVMGGGMQPQGHVQIIVNLVDFGMNLQEAGDAARMHHGGSSQPTGERMTDGGIVNLESGIGEAVRRDLAWRGHVIQHEIGLYGGYQAIYRDPETGVYAGASESRKDGHAAGY